MSAVTYLPSANWREVALARAPDKIAQPAPHRGKQLYGFPGADDSLALYFDAEQLRHCCTLFHPTVIAETLRDGYLANDGWRTERYSVAMVSGFSGEVA